MQLPAALAIMLNPETVQILVVDEVRVTGKPEEAVALDAKGVVLTFLVPGLLKVIV